MYTYVCIYYIYMYVCSHGYAPSLCSQFRNNSVYLIKHEIYDSGVNAQTPHLLHCDGICHCLKVCTNTPSAI